MESDLKQVRRWLEHDLTQVYIRLAILMTLLWFCVQILAPFLNLMVWSLILAVSLFPLTVRLSERLHLKPVWAALLLVSVGYILIGLPTILLGVSLADHLAEWVGGLDTSALAVPDPDPRVAEWPLIGSRLYELWESAHGDLSSVVAMVRPQLLEGGRFLLSAAANTAFALVFFLVALLVAGALMAYAATGTTHTRRLLITLTNETRAEEIQTLVVATVRSVANGVVGVAFVQALALGVGFLAIDLPAAGVIAVLAFFLGMIQLPCSLITFPVIAGIWLGGLDLSLTASVMATIYFLLAGLIDNVLKPYLLGRGVETPLVVVLLGALGGMAAEGLVGLFTGAVMLSVGYKLLMAWVDRGAGVSAELASERD